MAKTRVDVYQEVTDRVIEALEAGTIPWHRPWKTTEGELPRNLVSKKAYKGINIFLLAMAPHSSPYWMTYKQAAELGFQQWRKANEKKDDQVARDEYFALPVEDRGGVRKGEKATMIVFWNMIKNKSYDPSDKTSQKVIPFLRYYNVFNAEQTTGIDYPKPEPVESDFTPVEAAENILANFEGPKVVHGGNRAYYAPSNDVIGMPEREQFDTPEDYYSTHFHEAVHSTGHKSRLSRPEIVKINGFGTDEYSREELVAEMGAAMLCNYAGIEPGSIENTAAYIKGWLAKLHDDKKLLVSAAGRAQKAADFILGDDPEDEAN